MQLTKFGFLFAFVLVSSVSFAQEPLDSILVSGTRLPVKKIESGKNITIISSEEIKQLPITSVDELLQYIGGINTNSRAGFGVQSDIGMRGSTFSQVLILVDKQRINDPLTAHFNNNIPIPLSEIERIEIVRGPAAVSYGADAVGGIIQIITKTYAGLDKTRSASFNGQLAIGQHDLTITDVGFHQQNNKLGISTAIKTTNSVGEMHLNPNYVNAGLGDSVNYNHFNLKTYTSALTYKTGNWKAYARFGGDFRDFAAKYFYTSSAYDESKEWVKAYWTQAAFIHETSKGKTELNMGYRNNTDSFVFNTLFTPNFHTTKRLNSTLTHSTRWGKSLVSFGAQVDHQEIESTDRGTHTLGSQAAFFLAYRKFNKFTVNGGIRLEYAPNINLQFIPQLNLSYAMHGFVLRSSIGRSIRQADFTERYVSYLLPNLTPGRNVGNPDLAAESAYTFDLGIDGYSSNKFKWSNTLFVRQSSNLIDYVNTNSNSIKNLTNLQSNENYLYASNINRSSVFGNEFISSWMLLENQIIKLVGQFNYTFIKTVTPDSVVSKYIANHPIHNLNGNITMSSGQFNLLIGGAFITRNKENLEAINASILPNYTVLNSKLTFSLKTAPCKLFIDVKNLLNTQYQEILGARMPSRWIYGGLTWNL